MKTAGNTFSPTTATSDDYVHFNFYSNDDYLYRYDETASGQTPANHEIYVSDGVFVREDGGTPNTCPTHFPSGGIEQDQTGLLSELGKYHDGKEGYYNLLYTYHQFIDKGNTQGILNDIALSWPEDAWDLRNELMQRSPYNSDTVLIAAADKNILPHGMLLEIMIANPDALRGGRVINHVKCCIADPMPTYMTDILEGAKSIRTARTIMEHNISNQHAKMSRAHRKLMLHHITDSVGAHPDTLTTWYKEIKTREGRYALALEQVAQRNFQAASVTLDSIEVHLRPGGVHALELTETRKFIAVLEEAHQNDRTIAELDSAEVATLQSIADQPYGGKAAGRAENILCYFYGRCAPPPSYPKSANEPRKKPKPQMEELLSAQNKLTIKPNPADQYVEFEYGLLFAREGTELKVWDAQGRGVAQWPLGPTERGIKLLDTRRLAPGVYTVEVIQSGKRLLADKFIVRH